MPLLTVRLSTDATLAAALRELHLTAAEVDLDYGLVAVDPEQHLYALRVSDAAAARAAAVSDAAEIFADPRIGPAHDAGPDPRSPRLPPDDSAPA
ncbi:hypothetical protein C5E45_23290 [Nocardia nova]|uniref:Uncharacterized protein n=1 Tax=Nocardia nova TaxID=37330 RepID=A0A2S6AKM0_9NOCA|nr:hypothetical protein [Nocardia nova]PPJ22300.1 hypothetical protein C5E41_27490 [Nocardia nova]PPJ35762.1 hypothetical protein C5E45_23290 [Nocardia nova]